MPLASLFFASGSNIIFKEKVEDLVLLDKLQSISIEKIMHDEVIISAGAGVNWHQLVLWSLKQGFGGIENLTFISATVGAAPIQNIGAYGVELKDVFESLEAYDLQTGKHHFFPIMGINFLIEIAFLSK